jgi:hypothetical protein
VAFGLNFVQRLRRFHLDPLRLGEVKRALRYVGQSDSFTLSLTSAEGRQHLNVMTLPPFGRRVDDHDTMSKGTYTVFFKYPDYGIAGELPIEASNQWEAVQLATFRLEAAFERHDFTITQVVNFKQPHGKQENS